MTARATLSTFVLASVVGIGALLSPIAAQAQSVPCGQTHTVVPGDSLSAIARAAYGNTSSFQLIYSANAEVIGPNPELIEVGQVLRIPCPDETAPSIASEAVIRTEPTTEQIPAPEPRQIRIVVGTDWAPFTNEDQEQGGLATEITNVALSLADGSPEYKIDFINDWGAHLQPLITDHAYDFSIAWFRPNCDVVDKLGDGSKFRCNNLDWSDPIFEQIVGYYTRADELAVEQHADLMGRTLCRPSGYATFMLEEFDLVDPNITLLQPSSPTDCFSKLVSGEVDAVVLAADVSDGTIAELGVKDKVRFNDGLSYVATMHAVIAKTNPMSGPFLETLNSGLRKIKQNGEWFRIVVRHMAEHRSKTQ